MANVSTYRLDCGRVRALGLFLVVGLLVAAELGLARRNGLWNGSLAAALASAAGGLLLVGGPWVWLRATARVDLDATGCCVRHGGRSRRVTWEEVTGCWPDAAGWAITTSCGRRVAVPIDLAPATAPLRQHLEALAVRADGELQVALDSDGVALPQWRGVAASDWCLIGAVLFLRAANLAGRGPAGGGEWLVPLVCLCILAGLLRWQHRRCRLWRDRVSTPQGAVPLADITTVWIAGERNQIHAQIGLETATQRLVLPWSPGAAWLLAALLAVAAPQAVWYPADPAIHTPLAAAWRDLVAGRPSPPLPPQAADAAVGPGIARPRR